MLTQLLTMTTTHKFPSLAADLLLFEDEGAEVGRFRLQPRHLPLEEDVLLFWSRIFIRDRPGPSSLEI